MSLKTCHIDHLGPHRINQIEKGIMEQTVRFEQDLQWLRQRRRRHDERCRNKTKDAPLVVVVLGVVSLQCRLEDQPIQDGH
ncbi:hypothetical protein TNCV_332121 [Trichonephila clavipes]|nr:hypothetical protein TNCV_332121 [Trichonephila clavipes]